MFASKGLLTNPAGTPANPNKIDHRLEEKKTVNWTYFVVKWIFHESFILHPWRSFLKTELDFSLNPKTYTSVAH